MCIKRFFFQFSLKNYFLPFRWNNSFFFCFFCKANFFLFVSQLDAISMFIILYRKLTKKNYFSIHLIAIFWWFEIMLSIVCAVVRKNQRHCSTSFECFAFLFTCWSDRFIRAPSYIALMHQPLCFIGALIWES